MMEDSMCATHNDDLKYVGLDVSLDMTSVCVVNSAGDILWRGKCASTPEAIVDTLHAHAQGAVRVGLETGQLSNWLTLSLRRRHVPVICLDARHAKAALSLQLNKTDDNDALGLAHVVRTGWYREVAVKSMDSHALKILLVARAQLVAQRQTMANTIRGILKTYGLRIVRCSGGLFAPRVRDAIGENDVLMAVIEPLLIAWQALREQVAVLDTRVNARAKSDATVQRLMSVPGVGVIVALAFSATIDDPDRFKRSSSVGAYVGLTPRRYQSGEEDRVGRISRCGDALLRSYLFEAANVLLSRHPRECALKTWGLVMAKRIGMRRAKVAVARKIAVLLHTLWRNGEVFNWGNKADCAGALPAVA
uniref:IS110 family transposase n=1 Tax=Asaia bogorensis TaxID=91915 RepID=UPI0038D21CE6